MKSLKSFSLAAFPHPKIQTFACIWMVVISMGNMSIGNAVEPPPSTPIAPNAPQLPPPQIRPDALVLYDRAMAKYNAGDLPGALADFNEAIALQPDLVAAYVNRANIKDDQGDPLGALVDYRKALSLDAKDANIYLNRGLTYVRLERYTEAITDFEQAIALWPDYAPAHRSLGVTRYLSTNVAATKLMGLESVRKAAVLYRQQGQEQKAVEVEAIAQQMQAALNP